MALAQLARARLPHDLLAAPVRRQAFEEVVALDVTRVVAWRCVGRIEIDDRGLGLEREDVAAARPRGARDDGGVAPADGLAEQFLEAHAELPAAVVVARRGDREHAA